MDDLGIVQVRDGGPHWKDRGQSGWTDRSTHPDTRLNHANEFDMNIKGWLLNTPDYRLGTMLGYQQTRFSWTAFGGSFNYDNGMDRGKFHQDARAAGYKQKYDMPYLGMAGMYRYQNVEFNALLKFSPRVKAKDNDEHYMRDITFRHQGKRSKYYSATVDAGYFVTPNTKIYAELSLNKYEENKGSFTETCNRCGQNAYFDGNSSGMGNTYYTASAGVQYRF